MKLHPNEQRVLKFILEKGEVTHAELKGHFLPIPPSIIDSCVFRLAQYELIVQSNGKIRPSKQAQKLKGWLPEIPLRELVIPGGERCQR